MSVLMLLLVLALIGLAAWALTTYVPMPSAVKTVIIVVSVVICIIYALNALGIHIPNPGIPRN